MSALLLAAETAHELKQLELGDLLVYLAIIAAAMFFVIIAGLGYFTPSSGGGSSD